MSFEDRLHQAIERGRRRSEAAKQEAQARALTEEELKRLHSQYRLRVSEHIEHCIGRLPNHFPGFRVEMLYGDQGWGAACSRDDLRMRGGRRENDYSRLELTVRPYSELRILEIAAKGTICNKELMQRNYFEKLADVEIEKFVELVDVWVLEYAELFATRSN